MERRPSWYSRGLRCHSCGHYERNREDGWRVDKYRTDGRERRAQVTCGCLAYWFPHRINRGRCNDPA